MRKQDFENHYTKWHKANEDQNDTVCGILQGNRELDTGSFFVNRGRWICGDCLFLSNAGLYNRLETGEDVGVEELNQWLGGKALIVPTLLSLIHNRAVATAQKFAAYQHQQEGLNLAERVEELERIVERLLNETK